MKSIIITAAFLSALALLPQNAFAATSVFCRGLESSLTLTEDTRFNEGSNGTAVLIGLQSAAAENSRNADLFSNGTRVKASSLREFISTGKSVKMSDSLGKRKITITFTPDIKMATVELLVNGEVRLNEKQFCKNWQ